MLGISKHEIEVILHRANMEFWKSDMPYLCGNTGCCNPATDAKPMYHINPDKRNTSPNLVIKLGSLEEIYEFAKPVAEKRRKLLEKWRIKLWGK
jgi:hypothetical protein